MLALKYRAEFDLLTGIYNMHTFHAQTARLLRAAPDRRYSIIRLDVDRFKVLNDLYGIKEGDKLLVAMANLLRETLNGDGVCGRLGGDVFCVCVDYSRDRILDFIREITERLAEYPLPWKVVPSFGICEVDNLDTPINVLCDWANLALKTVKGSFLRRYAFYDDTLRQRILEEKNIENRDARGPAGRSVHPASPAQGGHRHLAHRGVRGAGALGASRRRAAASVQVHSPVRAQRLHHPS